MCSRIKWIIHANWINPTWGSHFAHRRRTFGCVENLLWKWFRLNLHSRAITIATENRAENHQHVRYILKLLHSISSQVALRFCAFFCHSCSWDHMSERSHVVIALAWKIIISILRFSLWILARCFASFSPVCRARDASARKSSSAQDLKRRVSMANWCHWLSLLLMSTNNANYQFEKSLHDNLIIDLASDGEEIIFECQPQRVSRNNEGIFLSSSLCTKYGLAGEITTRLRPVLISLLSV